VAAVSRLPLTPREPAAAPQPTSFRTNFRLFAPLAQSVQLAGTFNDWNPKATPLSRWSGGEWGTGVPLKPGKYEYKFIVDGVWQEDPLACDSVENPFGSRNSVKHVG
jgi:1,4-alpha-glucan branching enzyme